MLYAALGREATSEGRGLFWQFAPKAHMFQELAEYQSFVLGNPKTFWAYQDEDFVGWLAKNAASRGGPTQAATTTTKKQLPERRRGLSAL